MKANKSDKSHVGSPMSGVISEVRCKVDDVVQKGQPLVVLSAMKMEMVVQSPVAGKVKAIHISKDQKIEAEDLVVEIEEQK